MTQSEQTTHALAICAAMGELEARGLNRGSAGNVSVRSATGFLITPSGVPPAQLQAESIVAMDRAGAPLAGTARPSSEWRFHHDIYHNRPDANAVVHVHSPYATALSCHRRGVPAFHYMVAVAGGVDVRCAPYALFGTQALSDGALVALEGRRACLLANHGMITLGDSLAGAVALAVEVEELARHYNLSTAFGEPTYLDEDEMAAVIERFKTYGRQHGEE